MVIEESSVVAAASNNAKFWSERGGFHTRVLSTVKTVHVQFIGTLRGMENRNSYGGFLS